MSVLDARQGWWQARKKEWLGIGLRPELGREGVSVGGTAGIACTCNDPTATEPCKLRRCNGKVGAERAASGIGMIAQKTGGYGNTQGLSVFDSVLCELVYRWWCPPGGTVLDPFAGGSVRGVVAGHLGLTYHGVELRQAQVDDNRAQTGLVPADQPTPTWHTGDSTALDDIDGVPDYADLIFTCPPYADLEVYSDDPRDLSTMPYELFREMHALAITDACARLADHAFAVWVVGEVRGRDRGFYGLVPDTIRAFQKAGLQYATEAVLVTMVGHAAMRAARDFTAGRVLTRTHQNVLVFCKGDRRRATERLGSVDVTDALAEYATRYDDPEVT
jgi:hypothetical protein